MDNTRTNVAWLLKEFTVKYKLQYPHFGLSIDSFKHKCVITWYGLVFPSHYADDENSVIVSSIKALLAWLEIEKNFVHICLLDK